MNRSPKVAGGFAALTAAATLALVPFLKTHEGLSLKSYLDTAGVYTICYGHAYVAPNLRYTQKQCDDLLETDAGWRMKAVYDLMKYEPHPLVLAAHTSFAFNVGVGGWDKAKKKYTGYKGSNTLLLTNAGDDVGGCNAMANWYKSNGVDCRPRDTGCYGLWVRRQNEIKLCLQGAQYGTGRR